MARIGACALIRKDAHFPQVLRYESAGQTRTWSMFTTGSLVLLAAQGVVFYDAGSLSSPIVEGLHSSCNTASFTGRS